MVDFGPGCGHGANPLYQLQGDTLA